MLSTSIDIIDQLTQRTCIEWYDISVRINELFYSIDTHERVNVEIMLSLCGQDGRSVKAVITHTHVKSIEILYLCFARIIHVEISNYLLQIKMECEFVFVFCGEEEQKKIGEEKRKIKNENIQGKWQIEIFTCNEMHTNIDTRFIHDPITYVCVEEYKRQRKLFFVFYFYSVLFPWLCATPNEMALRPFSTLLCRHLIYHACN